MATDHKHERYKKWKYDETKCETIFGENERCIFWAKAERDHLLLFDVHGVLTDLRRTAWNNLQKDLKLSTPDSVAQCSEGDTCGALLWEIYFISYCRS